LPHFGRVHARHLSELVDKLEANGVALRILDFSGNAVDTRGATGRLMLNTFAAMAQFEREMMLERQQEGIAKAKAQGKYKGRKPTARTKAQDALRLFKEVCSAPKRHMRRPGSLEAVGGRVDGAGRFQ